MKYSTGLFSLRRMVSVFVPLTGFVVLCVLSACNPCGKGTDPGLAPRALRVKQSDASGAWLSGDSTIVKNDTAYFRMELITERVVHRGRFSFFPELTACSPLEPYLTIAPDSLSIIAVNDWDAGHPAGSSLADLTTVRIFSNWAGKLSDTSFHAFAIQCRQDGFLLHEASVCLLKTLCLNPNKLNTFVLRLKLRNGAVLQSGNVKLIRG